MKKYKCGVFKCNNKGKPNDNGPWGAGYLCKKHKTIKK